MTRVTLQDAEKDLEGLMRRARDGEEIIVVFDDVAVRLFALRKSPRRRAGALRDSLVVPARLLEPMSEDELREFWGGDPL